MIQFETHYNIQYLHIIYCIHYYVILSMPSIVVLYEQHVLLKIKTRNNELHDVDVYYRHGTHCITPYLLYHKIVRKLLLNNFRSLKSEFENLIIMIEVTHTVPTAWCSCGLLK